MKATVVEIVCERCRATYTYAEDAPTVGAEHFALLWPAAITPAIRHGEGWLFREGGERPPQHVCHSCLAGEKRTFHSLRHTFARVAIENSRPIFWLSKHLGHSSLDVTANVYGHFEKATRKREAEAMAGVFGV